MPPPPRPRTFFARRLLAPLVLLGLGGCGLKGPLYLPPPKPHATRAPSPRASTAARPAHTAVPR